MLNNNFALKFKKLDIIILTLCLIFSIGIMSIILGKNAVFSSNDRYVYIYQDNVRLDSLKVNLSKLKEDKTIVLLKEDYPKLINDFTIEISPKKGVRVINIDCHDHTCEKQGWVNMPNFPIVCIPNGVYIEIVAESSNGGDIIIGGVKYEELIP